MKALLPLLLSTVLITPAFAQTLAYNQVSFATETAKTINNDELVATLTKNAQAPTAKEIGNTLNKTINQAITLSKKYPNVQVSTGHQHTYPRYNNSGKIIGQTGSVSLNIKSQDFEQASDFIAELQAFMTVDNVSFQVSETTHNAHKKAMMSQAIQQFQDEARQISQTFGAKNYKIVKVELNHARIEPNRYEVEAMAVSANASAKVASQNFEAGDSRISYHVAGVIELVP